MEGLDPLTRLVEAASEALASTLGVGRLEVWRLLLQPVREEYGDLGFPLLRYTRRLGLEAEGVVGDVVGRLRAAGVDYAKASLVGGFLNFRVDASRAMALLLGLMRGGWRPRPPRHPEPIVYVVEHTSANPIHPLHMGHARNSALGDSLARLLEARGHRVNRRFYVDDVGRQSAVAALGFRILGVTDPLGEARRLGVKPDHLVGWVYAATHTAIDALKARSEGDREGLEKLAAALARLEGREPERGWLRRILGELEAMGDPEEAVGEIMRRYEAGEEPERSLVRSVAEATLEGFRETLGRLGVGFDDWDWESDLVWSGRVRRIIEEARRSPYYTTHKGAEALDLPRVVKELVLTDEEARSVFKLPRGFDVPPLILVRSDGTTLYTTRDIAYSIYKFEAAGADRVINVIGADQRLPQLQIRLALLALGYRKEALNMMHYDYEIVRLPGRAMSGRRGEYVALDDVLEEVKARAREEVLKRNPEAPRDWVEDTAERIAVGAVRFSLIQASAPKPLVFDPDKALDFRENSGPYLQYTYARAMGILGKHGPIDWDSADPAKCSGGQRRRLLMQALRFPITAAKAADDLAPEDLAAYLVRLADQFNSWYQVDQVIRDPDPGSRECKAALVKLIADTLEEGMKLLGIPPTPRM